MARESVRYSAVGFVGPVQRDGADVQGDPSFTGLPGPRPNPAAPTEPSLSRDDYAADLIHSLREPADDGDVSWGVMRTLVWGVPSFGVIPVVAWCWKFSLAAEVERQRLWHFAEWTRAHSHHPQATVLRNLTDRMGARGWLSVLSLILCGLVALALVTEYVSRGWTPGQLLERTYRIVHGPGWRVRPAEAAELYATWVAGLSCAYLLHWAHVRMHAADLRRFVKVFNQLAASQGLAPVPVPGRPTGLKLSWIVAGAGLAFNNALWGVPMALAGAAMRRQFASAGPAVRHALADRVVTLLRSSAPPPVTAGAARRAMHRCGRERCRAPMPPTAHFCPRCGARAAG